MFSKGDLNKNVASVHDEKKPFKCEICTWGSMNMCVALFMNHTKQWFMHYFMRKRNQINKFVTTVVLKKEPWIIMLHEFMRKRNHLNVKSVTIQLFQKGNHFNMRFVSKCIIVFCDGSRKKRKRWWQKFWPKSWHGVKKVADTKILMSLLLLQ